MARSKFDSTFADVDSDAVRGAIVSALISGGSAAADSYGFSKPRSDSYTFGVDLWRFVWGDLEEAFRGHPGAKVRRPQGSFIIDLGPGSLYPVRVRATGGVDVPASRMMVSDLRRNLLGKPSAHLPLGLPEVVTIAYTGRPDRGVVRAWVGVATLAEDDTLDWRWCEELKLGGPTGGGQMGEDDDVVTAFYHAPEPMLQMELRGNDGTGDAREQDSG